MPKGQLSRVPWTGNYAIPLVFQPQTFLHTLFTLKSQALHSKMFATRFFTKWMMEHIWWTEMQKQKHHLISQYRSEMYLVLNW